ncbi:MAG: 2,3-bisphosphoglycerate-independent phosphoglycerate mutase [Alphaproteobacteria bacterium]|nr:2,3-bisphosphoglycerate-independent phosphoglycerate mutase [Alphaproteobacteria bacterium]
MLCVLDGFGWNPSAENNAVALARKPNFDRLWQACPHAFLRTSGLDVGLPEGQMGNSEVGHLNLGAGRVVMQDLPRIDAAIADRSLAADPTLNRVVSDLQALRGTAHVIGLLSPGGVHSHQNHAVALIKLLTQSRVPVVVHAILDGRDTPPKSAEGYLKRFVADLGGVKNWRLGTVIGRYWAMDRDKRMERTWAAYRAIVDADAPVFKTWQDVLVDSYSSGKTDEFVRPAVIEGYKGVNNQDGVICFNFRADRVRQILDSMLNVGFSGFVRPRLVHYATALGMTEYSVALNKWMHTLFKPIGMENILGKVVADAGLKQLRAAETEKYPHVTYFFNGGEETPYPGEERILVPSPKVATYDLQPEMSAAELTDKVVAAIDSGAFDFAVLNYANPDMVGHTGILAAAIKAVEAADAGLGRIAAAVERQGGALLVTADHGNCEQMIDPETGAPHTAHTLNPVPMLLMGGPEGATLVEGRLADIAPTLLQLMGLPQPAEMTGQSLLRRAPGAGA